MGYITNNIWLVVSGGLLCDHIGSFCPASVPLGELLVRLQSAWVRVVGAGVSHRSDFEGFCHVQTRACEPGCG